MLDEGFLSIYPLGLLQLEGEVLVEGKSRAGRGQGAIEKSYTPQK